MNNFKKYKYQKLNQIEDNALDKLIKDIYGETSEQEKQQEEKSLDELLDEYNDSMALYQMFGDQEYKDRADNIMKRLRGEI